MQISCGLFAYWAKHGSSEMARLLSKKRRQALKTKVESISPFMASRTHLAFQHSSFRNAAIVIVGLFAFFSQLPAQTVNQSGLRCSEAIMFCQTTYRASFPTDSTFLTEPLPTSSCFSDASTGRRVNALWYKFTVYQSGDLGFGIQPMNSDGTLNSRVNLDWALYRLTDSTLCGNLGEPILCNTSERGGLTGAIEADTPQESLAEPLRNVSSGETYLLVVVNPDNHRFGYTIDLGFSSVQNLTLQPALTLRNLTSPRNVCQTNTLTIEISDNLRVKAVTSGSFSVISARGVARTVTQVSSRRFGLTTSASEAALDNVFTLSLNMPIEQSEIYTVRTVEVLPSICRSLATDAQVSGLISVGPQVEITGFREYCAVGARLSASADFRSYFWENSRTGASVGSSRTVVVPEGEYRLIVVDNNGCQASTSAFVRSTTNIVLSLSAKGSKTSFCNFGDGRDGVELEATPGFDRYEWFFNGTPATGIATSGTTSTKYVFDSPGLYSVRAFVNGCESVSNTIRVTMRAVPAKPQIRRVGNFLTIVNPAFPGANYYWVQRLSATSNKGLENGWDCSPATSGTFFVQLTNENGCTLDSDTLSVNIAPVRMRLETGSYSSERNRQFDIQFRITRVLNTAQMAGATSVTFSLRFNGNLLAVLGANQRGMVRNQLDSLQFRRLTLNFPLNALTTGAPLTVTIGTLRVLALVPSGMAAASLSQTTQTIRATNTTVLALEDIACFTPNGKVIQGIRIDTTLGIYRLLGVGFSALAESSLESPIEDNISAVENTENSSPADKNSLDVNVYPNPRVSENLSLSLMLRPKAASANGSKGGNSEAWQLSGENRNTAAAQNIGFSAWLQDAFGNRVKTLLREDDALGISETNNQTTSLEREFDVRDVPRGTYFLIVRTSTGLYRTVLLTFSQ